MAGNNAVNAFGDVEGSLAPNILIYKINSFQGWKTIVYYILITSIFWLCFLNKTIISDASPTPLPDSEFQPEAYLGTWYQAYANREIRDGQQFGTIIK